MAFLLSGCDRQRIAELEEGVATEADVRARFGTPEAIWEAPGGGYTLEYNRNPAGHQNYMITIGPDGRMSSLRQVLHPGNFAQVKPGMSMEQVRRMLGKPARQMDFPLRNQAAWDWRWMQPPNTSMFFTVWFDRDWRVVGSETRPDTEAPENR
ncbi:outer membrane protein assembly factor BamE domain-containing protein [Ramlibacter rhizophilus]|uniref:Outer membrane protein assembly factor BamE n=1 Tax=Ramlibacter rhizophilus TaxID=1781167 RepID=A0A4Z0BUK8_9BURK|nr:outer membrane protein assembly factor BamE [Ramlibacter rhizophilus]TFZ01705.1 outer membrane protein assembly factor BamE [Ramlibacter rhizophilus]